MANSKVSEGDMAVQDVLNMIKRVENKLNDLEMQNNETQLLLRILVEPILSSTLQEVFKSPKHLYAYELSNGERSTRDIGNLVKLDQKGISNWWREWEKDGLVEKVGKKGNSKLGITYLNS